MKRMLWLAGLCVLALSTAAQSKKTIRFQETLAETACTADVISAGYRHGNRIRIRLGDATFFEDVVDGPESAGLYVVALHKGRRRTSAFTVLCRV